jgi:hypothetical protein
MILNSNIWQQTIEAAKAKAEGNAPLLRAIDRAIIEIERALYWSFVAGVLRLQSTTSKKLYVIDDAHTCEATANGFKFCKHSIARRLMLRYTQNLGVAAATMEAQRGHEVVTTKRLHVEPSKSPNATTPQRRTRRAAVRVTELTCLQNRPESRWVTVANAGAGV